MNVEKPREGDTLGSPSLYILLYKLGVSYRVGDVSTISLEDSHYVSLSCISDFV